MQWRGWDSLVDSLFVFETEATSLLSESGICGTLSSWKELQKRRWAKRQQVEMCPDSWDSRQTISMCVYIYIYDCTYSSSENTLFHYKVTSSLLKFWTLIRPCFSLCNSECWNAAVRHITDQCLMSGLVCDTWMSNKLCVAPPLRVRVILKKKNRTAVLRLLYVTCRRLYKGCSTTPRPVCAVLGTLEQIIEMQCFY